MNKRLRMLLLSGTGVILIALCGSFAYGINKRHELDARSQANTVTNTVAPTLPTVDKVLKLVNVQRTNAGATPLTIDEGLNQSAQRKADDMVKYRYFNHVSPNDGKHGYDYVNDTDTGCLTRGENIYEGSDKYSSADSAIYWWMHSPAHKKAMLSSQYNLTGFGIALRPDNQTVVFVEHFCQSP